MSMAPARLQTVARGGDALFRRLIEAFRDLTGVPMLLNTSFNESEPIVCTPREALDCFLRTKMDSLVLGPFVIERAPRQPPSRRALSAFRRCKSAKPHRKPKNSLHGGVATAYANPLPLLLYPLPAMGTGDF